MPTVNSTAGADNAVSSNRCRSFVNVAAASGISARSGNAAATSAPCRLASLLRNQRIQPLVRVRAGLIDGFLIEDQILHRLSDELARFRIGHDGIADFGRSLCRQHVERSLPLLAYGLFVNPLAILRIVGDGG